MSSEFNWWLLLVGIVVGAGLAWLVLADFGRTDEPLDEETEIQLEADWIAARFAERDRPVDRAVLAEALELDRLYRTPDVRLAPTRPRAARSPSVEEARSDAPDVEGD